MGGGDHLAMEGVHKTYRMGDVLVRALRGVDLVVERSSFLSVVGPSGSGKSTLLHIMGCLDRPSSGTVRFLGDRVDDLSDAALTRLRLRQIGFVFQSFYLIPTLRAIENVELPMREAGLSRWDRRRRAEDLLKRMGLGHRAKHFPHQLSGGEQQRVAIARALANEPQLLLADEPTGEVDSATAAEIMDLFTQLNRDDDVTIVMVTHDEAMARRAGRTVRMKDGRIVA